MTPDPFPSELVEAAACAITTSGRRGSTDQEAQAYDAAYAVLAAVVPLIEQRVIDRLAGEAGENPYRDLSMPLLSEACKIEAEVWDAGAACGVAAERARWEGLLRPLDLSDPRLDEARPLDTLSVPQSAETWRAIRAALASPQPATEPDEGAK